MVRFNDDVEVYTIPRLTKEEIRGVPGIDNYMAFGLLREEIILVANYRLNEKIQNAPKPVPEWHKYPLVLVEEQQEYKFIGIYSSKGKGNGSKLYQGPKGGVFYFTSSGTKRYVKL